MTGASRKPATVHGSGRHGKMRPMVDLKSRTFLVTGANTGIGKETARVLAGRGGRVILAGRSEPKTRAAIDEIAAEVEGADLDYLSLDLGDLDSVRRAAAEVREPLHVLVNNAGLAGSRGLTASGFELAFGTNHVGPFLLTNLLLDRLLDAAPDGGARIVNVASVGHFQARGIDWEAVRRPTATRTGFPEYCVSKLANVLHAQELARRLDGTGVTSYALHPGAVASDVWRKVPWPIRPAMKLFMKSVEDGAKTSVFCATDPDLATQSGRYYDSSREMEPSSVATPSLAADLWTHSESWTT